ncbi:unnamed protein product [Phaedon cochleariae]|uniref:Multiple inositol polyphosphate phosphatase 1 n=1 Tax=Phaedon cochleariae TaxID=80249 RepID=A0A9N9SIT9_PHACE|nr:unnamed protein product [Phaedon cochleariae]
MSLNEVLLLFLFTTLTTSQNNFNNQGVGDNRNDDCCEDYCYGTDEEPYLNFATKTAYDNLNHRRSESQHLIPECTAVQFWSLIRHGTRLPDVEEIKNFRGLSRLHEEIAKNYHDRRSYPDRGRLCPKDYELFIRWRFNDSISESKANSLTSQGMEDMKQLARRFKWKYPQLFQSYDERSYNFQYSSEDRSHDSFQAYAEGLFGSDAYRIHSNTINAKDLTKPNENCPKWSENVDNNTAVTSEAERFLQNSEYMKMTRDVFRRLGFRYSLNATVISDIYDLCRYEKAWIVQERSPWCVAFNKDQLKLLEYAEDLKYYYKFGYGNQLSNRVGCAPVKDMYERFEKTVNGNSDGTKGTFLFTSTATIQTVLTTLGIGKDFTPLTADNYHQQSKRNWRTSLLNPFAANLAAVLYECRSGEKHRVMFFLNENPVEFTDCSVGLCTWSTVQQKIKNTANNCNLQDFCNGNSSAMKYFNHALLFVMFVVFKSV